MAYVVGIGSSAGGLEALFSMLPQLPLTGNATYIIAQHMMHDGHSNLTLKLLNRCSHLEVILATQDQPIAVDKIYLIPAGSDGILKGERLTLVPPVKENHSTPSVNVLFESIAQSCQSSSIGVILSGTGSDGVRGCRAIKRSNGVTIAQRPTTAVFDGMPCSAIEAGVVDAIVDATQIAEVILRHIQKTLPPLAAAEHTQQISPVEADQDLTPILALVLQKTGVNFTGYRPETLRRRLKARMSAFKIETLADYYHFLTTMPNEAQQIQQLFLVSFSSFFRDAASFHALKHTLQAMVEQKKTGEAINIWVAGCASGEEVYTIAMLLDEIKTATGADNPVHIKGSDLNPVAIHKAQAGEYSSKVMNEMMPTQVSSYFSQQGEKFVVKDRIKTMCHFALENVFSADNIQNLDVISCRNLLIYFKGPLQDKLTALFHDSLAPHGLLFLGQSESLSPSRGHLFKTLDLHHKLYMRV